MGGSQDVHPSRYFSSCRLLPPPPRAQWHSHLLVVCSLAQRTFAVQGCADEYVFYQRRFILEAEDVKYLSASTTCRLLTAHPFLTALLVLTFAVHLNSPSLPFKKCKIL